MVRPAFERRRAGERRGRLSERRGRRRPEPGHPAPPPRGVRTSTRSVTLKARQSNKTGSDVSGDVSRDGADHGATEDERPNRLQLSFREPGPDSRSKIMPSQGYYRQSGDRSHQHDQPQHTRGQPVSQPFTAPVLIPFRTAFEIPQLDSVLFTEGPLLTRSLRSENTRSRNPPCITGHSPPPPFSRNNPGANDWE